MVDLPKPGDRIPLERVFVSRANVNFGVPFGEDEKDKILVGHLSRRDMTDMMKARIEEHPDGELGYGVYDGRRRLFSLKKKGKTYVTVGTDITVEDVPEETAYEKSLLSNLDLFKKAPDPVARAMALNKIMSSRTRLGGIRGLSRAWNIPASTLSDWLSVLRLTPKMQAIASKGVLMWKDVRKIARMRLTETQQDSLAEIAEKDGVEAFKEELEKLKPPKSRGLPKDTYFILRTSFDKRNKFDKGTYQELERIAEERKMHVDELAKEVLREYVKKHKKS